MPPGVLRVDEQVLHLRLCAMQTPIRLSVSLVLYTTNSLLRKSTVATPNTPLTNIEVADGEIIVEVEDELAVFFKAFGFNARPSRRSDGVVVAVLPQNVTICMFNDQINPWYLHSGVTLLASSLDK